MDNKDPNSVNEAKTAVDCIRQSPICTDSRYNWIHPAIESVLAEEFDSSDLSGIIKSLMSSVRGESLSLSTREIDSEEIEEPLPAQVGHAVMRLKSIDSVSNVGLLTCLQPIELNEGLNVFFGKNAAGKSSLYLAICKILGKPKPIYPDVSSQKRESNCQLSYVNNSEKVNSISWTSGQSNPDLKAKIFDATICNSVVMQDQVNEFEIAHLKTEYFSFLHDLFEDVQSELEGYSIQLDTKLSTLKTSLDNSAPFICNTKVISDMHKLEYASLTEPEQKHLAKIEKQLQILNKEMTVAVIKNLTTAKSQTERILSTFGYQKVSEEELDTSQLEWQLKYDKEYFKTINQQIRNYSTAKAAYEKTGKQKLPASLPEDWIENELWRDFINKGIQFITSLDEKLKHKYRDKTCLYCLQPLQTAEAQALIKAYNELNEEYEAGLSAQLLNIQEKSAGLANIIILFKVLTEINGQIEAEFESIDKKDDKISNYNNLEKQFKDIKSHTDLQHEFQIKDDFMQSLAQFWHQYDDLWQKFSDAIKSYESAIKNRDEEIKKLEAQAESLRQKKLINENKDSVLNYIKFSDSKKRIQNYQSDLTVLKRLTSSLKTRYSNEETIKEFKNFLDHEYANLDYSPPASWHIYPVTRDGINKRVYNLGDKRLSEIFSEGEKTIHALADFFAQCEIEKYQGLYIFDDPVNSLDEDNIRNVANRVKSLVHAGNQVLIFTHSLPFLNCLIDPEKDQLTHLERTKYSIVIEANTKLDSIRYLKVKYNMIAKGINEMITTNNSGGSILEFHIRPIYDIMSNYMETWVEKVLLKDIVTRYRPNIRMGSLSELKSINMSLISKAHDFYQRTSRNGMRHSQPNGVPSPTFDGLLRDFEEFKRDFHYKG